MFATGLIGLRGHRANTTLPVTVDTTGGVSNAVQTYTQNITIGANSNRLLLVGLSFDSASNGTTPSSVTFDGSSMTRLTGFETADGVQLHMYYIVAPSTGTKVLSVTGPGAAANDGLALWASLYNVDQVAPLGTPNANGQTSGGVSNAPATSITGFTNGLSFAWWGCWNSSNGAVTATETGSGQTVVSTVQRTLGDNLGMSQMTGGATNAFSWTLSSGAGAQTDTCSMSVGVKPA